MRRNLQGIAMALLLSLATVSFAARGSFQTGSDNAKRYPGTAWQPTKRFCELYDWSSGGSATPCIYGGFSSSGNWSYSATCGNSAKALCATPTSWKHDAPCGSVKNVPILTLTGQQDFGQYDIDIAAQANTSGNRESVVMGRGMGHNYQDPALAFIFYAECIRLRYPPGSSGLKDTPRDKGWLGDMSVSNSMDTDCPYVRHYSQYARDKSKAAWLPTRYFSYCWRASVVGKGTADANPILISAPVRSGNNAWEGWPEYNAGDPILIRIASPGYGEDRVDICDGDIVLKSFPKNAYGVYQYTWQESRAGIRAILAVAYKGAEPVAVSRFVPVIVRGTVKFDPVELEPTSIGSPPPAYGHAFPQTQHGAALQIHWGGGYDRLVNRDRLLLVNGQTRSPSMLPTMLLPAVLVETGSNGLIRDRR